MTTTNPQPQPQQWAQPPKQHNGFGITAIVLGAVGAIFAFIPLVGMFISWPAAIIALIMAGLALGFMFAKKASLVISILGAVFAAAALVMSIVATVATDEALSSDDAHSSSDDGKADTSGEDGADKDKKADKKSKENTSPNFTQTAKWSDGLSAKVLSAKTRQANEGDIDSDPGDRVVVFKVKLHNGTKKSYDSDLGEVKVNYGKNGQKAEDVNGASMFEGKIPSGESKTQKFEYAIPKKGDAHVNMEVDPGAFDLKTATFTGSIKPVLNG